MVKRGGGNRRTRGKPLNLDGRPLPCHMPISLKGKFPCNVGYKVIHKDTEGHKVIHKNAEDGVTEYCIILLLNLLVIFGLSASNFFSLNT